MLLRELTGRAGSRTGAVTPETPAQQKGASRFRKTPWVLTCGAEGNRTPDLLLAKQMLYQLSYSPKSPLVGLAGFEPATSSLSVTRSNHLSYRPSNEWKLYRHSPETHKPAGHAVFFRAFGR